MRAKKSLGQNFLKSNSVLKEIVEAGEVVPTDTVLEIGPGKGALTKVLLEKANKVVAIEKDDLLIPILEETFRTEIQNKKLSLIHGDIMEHTPKSLGVEGEYKLIANIPYYITGQIIRNFLTTDTKPKTIVLLVQKEVADRIVARDGKESLLSISIKVYGTPKYIGKVSKKYFSPMPKVDSAIIKITNINKDFFDVIDEKDFFEIARTGFQHKRKQLLGNLKQKYKNIDVEKMFTAINLNKKIRAEDVSLEHWKYFTQSIYPKKLES